MDLPNQSPNQQNGNNFQLPNVTPNAKDLKNCKKCKNLINKNLKVCPYCGEKNNNTGKGCAIVAAIFAFIVIVPLIAGTSSEESTDTSANVSISSSVSSVVSSEEVTSSEEEVASSETVEKETNSEQGLTQSEREALAKVQQEQAEKEERAKNNIYLVGETMTTDRVKITFKSAEDYIPEKDYAKADEGNKIVRAYFVVENIGNSDIWVTSYDFKCYADDAAVDEHFWSIDDEINSAKLSTGRKTEGYIYYEVPENVESIEIEYETSYWTQKKATFIVK